MTGFIPVNFDDVVEPKPVAAGRYEVQVTDAKIKMTGERSRHPNKPQIVLTLGIPSEPDAPTFQHYVSLPHEEDEPASAKFKALLYKRLMEAFNTPYDKDGIDPEKACFSLQGARANVELKQESNDSGSVFNSMVLPRLQGEATSAPSGGRKS